jgi:alkylation response protein AidB-like acyl-CoA dehydrogenase
MSNALTVLSDDEKMFRESVLGFARERVAPRVSEMDEKSVMDKSIIDGLFELGVMGIEVPEDLGGAGSSFFTAILAIEAFAQVDPSVAVLVDVQNTLVENAILRWGSDDQKKRYLPKMCKEWIGSYALSESGSGSDAFALKTRAEKRGD